jgi:transposase-like protein
MIGAMPFKARPFVVGRKDRETLKQWIRSPTMPQQWVLRARIVVASGEGEGVRQIARRFEVTPATVCQWRSRYVEKGLAGLRTRPRRGRPRVITDAKERAVVAKTLSQPKAVTHWSCRSLAKEVGLSPATVHRIWQTYDLQPHRTTTFKFSGDPEFERKLADVVGLYLDPPEKALVLCVDEKSQIQALNRTQPLLPMRPGLPADDARLQKEWHHEPVRGLGSGQRESARPLLSPTHPRGVHRVPQLHQTEVPPS